MGKIIPYFFLKISGAIVVLFIAIILLLYTTRNLEAYNSIKYNMSTGSGTIVRKTADGFSWQSEVESNLRYSLGIDPKDPIKILWTKPISYSEIPFIDNELIVKYLKENPDSLIQLEIFEGEESIRRKSDSIYVECGTINSHNMEIKTAYCISRQNGAKYKGASFNFDERGRMILFSVRNYDDQHSYVLLNEFP